MKQKSKFIVGIVLIILSILCGASIRLTHSDMSEASFSMLYWKEYIGLIIVMFIGYYFVRKGLDN